MTAIPISLLLDSSSLPPGPPGEPGPQGEPGIQGPPGVGVGFRVEDYGAVGNGIADDYAAILATINACVAAGGGSVVFGPKTYRTSQHLPCTNNTEWRGVPGKTVIKPLDGIDKQIIYTPSRGTTNIPVEWFSLYGIIFDGNKQGALKAAATSAAGPTPCKRFRAEKCVFRNATGYGLGFQTHNNIGVSEDVYLLDCDFHDNGDGVGSTTYDGLDVKDCDRLTMMGCTAHHNTNDGLDFRGRTVLLMNCAAWANGGYGASISANVNGLTTSSSMTVIGGSYSSNQTGILVANDPAGGTGYTRVSISGAEIDGNSGDGIQLHANNTNTRIYVRAFVSGNGQNVNIIGTPAAQDIVVMG
jgi:hypothetical protein